MKIFDWLRIKKFLLALSIIFVFSGRVSADGNTTSGTIWDHVPEGGSIRAESNGSWTILDRNSNPIGNVPPGQTRPTPQTPAVPQGNAAETWTPENLKGTVWDQVPEGGAIRANADNTWTILDRNGNVVGTYPPAPASGGSSTAAAGNTTAGSVTGGGNDVQPRLPPPLTTPLPGGGVMTSQQQADGSWSHHYRREDSDGTVVDYDIRPTDENFPHEDPRFWRPGQSSPDRIVTRTEGGGTITSVKNPDGTWRHTYQSANGNVSYRLKPGDELYPQNDPRFQDPNRDQDPFRAPRMGSQSSNPLGRDLIEGQFADARENFGHPED